MDAPRTRPRAASSLRRKVLAAVALGVAALCAVIYFVTDRVVMAGFLASEQASADAKARSTREIVGTMLTEYVTRMTDWAEWDEMARLLAGENQKFADENLTPSALAALRWDVLCVARFADGEKVALTGLDPAREKFVPVDPALLSTLFDPRRHFRPGPPVVALQVVGETVWVTASRDVKNSDQSEPKRPGRFLTCSRVDEAWLARLRKFTFLDASLHRADESIDDEAEAQARQSLGAALNEVVTLPLGEDHLASFGWLPDLDGKASVLLRVDAERPLLDQGRRILRTTLASTAIAGALFLLLAWSFVARLTNRIGSLLGGVEALRSGDFRPVSVERDDEIGRLSGAFNEMAARIADRERSLQQVNDRIQLVLDSIGDGLVSCGLDGTVTGGVSKRAEQWFGPGEGRKAWDYLFPDDEIRRVEFELGWQQIQEDQLPFELLVDQIPRHVHSGGDDYEVEFHRVSKDGVPTGLLLVVRDVTLRLERERAEAQGRELQNVVANLLRDPADFERFLGEMQNLVETTEAAPSDEVRARSLHTLKGNAAIYGFVSFAEYCHGIEDALAQGVPFGKCGRELENEWQAAVARIRSFLPETGEPRVVLSLTEYDRFLDGLRTGADTARLALVAESWRYQPLSQVFARLARQARRLGSTLGRKLEVVTEDSGIRFEPEAMQGFWEAFVHVVRNAVDHGLEPVDDRIAAGKPPQGRILLGGALVGDELVVTVTDDGRGVDWPRVAESARERGLPCATHADLVSALFTDGLSTRDSVSEVSGRGVGLAAVREVVEELGGRFDVTSRTGLGTTFTFRLPKYIDAQVLAVGLA